MTDSESAKTIILGITITPWKIVGFAGTFVFGTRFIIQWVASERAKKSVIPFGFWEASALGSILLLGYFGLYRHDSVGVIQQALPLPIYLRNIYFRYTHKREKESKGMPSPAE